MVDEHDVISRVRAGDSAALGEFLELRRRPLLAYIERNLGTALRRKVEAEDIFQEASAEAVRSFGEMDLSERDPFGWLCQVSERRIIDAHRKFFGTQKRDAAREIPLQAGGGDTSRGGVIDLLVASITTPSQAFSKNAREIKMQSAIDTLPEQQRQALRWRYVDGLPSKQIAERLGKSDGAVRVMLTRAVGKLQTMLGGDGKQ